MDLGQVLSKKGTVLRSLTRAQNSQLSTLLWVNNTSGVLVDAAATGGADSPSSNSAVTHSSLQSCKNSFTYHAHEASVAWYQCNNNNNNNNNLLKNFLQYSSSRRNIKWNIKSLPYIYQGNLSCPFLISFLLPS